MIKFPTLILLYWVISLAPYFLGLFSLREQGRTFHRLLLSPWPFAFWPWLGGKGRVLFWSVWWAAGDNTQRPRACVSPGLCRGHPGHKMSPGSSTCLAGPARAGSSGCQTYLSYSCVTPRLLHMWSELCYQLCFLIHGLLQDFSPWETPESTRFTLLLIQNKGLPYTVLLKICSTERAMCIWWD